MPAFAGAVKQGYKIIELDVSVTKDMKFVLLHDSSINRTARHENGSVISAFASDELASLVKQYASLGVWILSDEKQLSDAVRIGADVIETNGQLKPIVR